MGKKTKILFIFLFVWALGASYLASKSPIGIQVIELTRSIMGGSSNNVPYQKGYSFVLSTVKSYYNISTDTSIGEKEVFLNSYFSKSISSNLKEDYLVSAKKAKDGKLKRDFSIDQILYNLKNNEYIVSVKVNQASEDFGEQIFYIKLSITLKKAFDGSNNFQIVQWKEAPNTKPFEGYLLKEFFVKGDLTSRVIFPCNTNSLVAQNTTSGIDTKTFKSGSLVEFSFKKDLEVSAVFTSRCKSRKFQTHFVPANESLTLYRRVALSEGRLPPKPKTDVEKALEGLKGWGK